MTRWTSTPAVGAGALVVVLLTSACTGGTGSGGGSSSSTTGTTTSSATASTGSTMSRADATDSAPPPRPSPSPPGVPRTEDVETTGGDGETAWSLWLPSFLGSVGEAANSKIRASADHGVRAAAASGGPHDITAEGRVTTNDGRTLQVRIRVLDVTGDDPQPLESVTTVALAAADASPVFLEDQLADPAAAWEVLAREVTAAATRGELTVERPVEARAEEFADWQTDSEGLELYFQHGQFGRGAPSLVIPWRTVEPLLTPEGKALLAP